MTTYLLTFRPPVDYDAPADTFDRWARWQVELGVRLKERGNPAVQASAIGNCGQGTRIGGYSLIRASSLEEAVELAHGCPLLSDGGGVEIGELLNHDDAFDEWLDDPR